MAEIEWNNHFYYDETSPSCIKRAANWMAGRDYKVLMAGAGSNAGSLSQRGYYEVKMQKKIYQVHRIVWALHHGSIEDSLQIDHIDGNPSNNRISNLRLVSIAENARNRKKRSDNSSGKCGVSLLSTTSKNGYINDYWVAGWMNIVGKFKQKCFPINKLGYDEAFRQASEYRAKMIEELNTQDAGYTERHGTERNK